MTRTRGPQLPFELMRFVVVGLIGFGVDFGLLWALHDGARAPLWLSTVVAFLLSFFVTYTLQRTVAFQSASPHGRALLKYAALVSFNTIAAVAIVGIANTLADSWVVGKVASTAVTTVWNYFIYRWWIFPKPKAGRASVTDRPSADA